MHLAFLWNRVSIIGLLVLLAGFFSGSETAVFSLGRAQRESLAQSARLRDRLLLDLLRRPDRLIATILVGNELVNTAIGAFTTAIGQQLFAGQSRLTVTIGTTALILPILVIFGEIIPKSIAIKVPEIWSSLASRPLALFAVVVAPVRAVVRGVAGAVTWLLGVRGVVEEEPDIREAEFRTMVDVGREEGEVRGDERRLIHNVFEFTDKRVGELMQPLDRVFAVSADLPMARVVDAVTRGNFSRVPVYQGRRDNVIGMVLAKDLVGYTRGMLPTRPLSDIIHRNLAYVPKASRCERVFREMQRRRVHLVVVVDEYGRAVGLVTMDDLLRELFGALRDEPDSEAAGGPTPTPGPDTPEEGGGRP